jgi:hypothetical protein
VRAWIAACEVAAKRRELRAIDRRRVLARHAAEAQATGEPARGGVGVDVGDGRGHGDRPPRGEGGGADPDDREEQGERGENADADAPHAKPRGSLVR